MYELIQFVLLLLESFFDNVQYNYKHEVLKAKNNNDDIEKQKEIGGQEKKIVCS